MENEKALAEFTEYFVVNYPGHTIITDPNWHASKIFRAAERAIRDSGQAGEDWLGEELERQLIDYIVESDGEDSIEMIAKGIIRIVRAALAASAPAPTTGEK